MSAIPQELLGLRVEVVRSIRRTAALHIVGSALQVRVPAQLADERVAAILQQKRPWISSKVAQRQQLPPHRPRELVSGESFPYLGRVVDYVVIHELAHLVHANHSRAFWLLVERHCPAFALHRTWLKERAHRLL